MRLLDRLLRRDKAPPPAYAAVGSKSDCASTGSTPPLGARYDVHPAAVEAVGMVCMTLDPEGEFVLHEDYAQVVELVREVYEWTKYKDTHWARRAAKVLGA